jgi:hypothetical protein
MPAAVCGIKLKLCGYLTCKPKDNGSLSGSIFDFGFLYAIGFYIVFVDQFPGVFYVLIQFLQVLIQWFISEPDLGIEKGVFNIYPMGFGQAAAVGAGEGRFRNLEYKGMPGIVDSVFRFGQIKAVVSPFLRLPDCFTGKTKDKGNGLKKELDFPAFHMLFF